jgi:hypothetical protein
MAEINNEIGLNAMLRGDGAGGSDNAVQSEKEKLHVGEHAETT